MASKVKKQCKYGAKCYRKNKQHLEEFSHPESETRKKTSKEETSPPPKRPKRENSEKEGKKKRDLTDYFGKKTVPKNDDGRSSRKAKEEEERVEREDKKEKKEKTEPESAASSTGEDKDGSSHPEKSDTSLPPPPRPADIRADIKEKFLMDMPEDFYDFWKLAESINSSNPNLAFRKSLGLELVGPFDVLGGRCVGRKGGEDPCYLLHWRYFYDPPEFMTVVRGEDQTQFHFGYFRDDPREMPVFVASNAAKTNSKITARGDNLFAAFSWFIDDYVRENKSAKSALMELKKKIADAAKAGGYSLEQKSKSMKERDKKVNCRLFHGAGMVVPVDDNDVGYREVPETPGDLKKMFKAVVDAKTDSERDAALDPIMEIIMLVQFANDECDYGEGLELGLNMFSYGGGDTFKGTLLNLLPMAYQLLGRHEYGKIIQAHLQHRSHSASLSQSH